MKNVKFLLVIVISVFMISNKLIAQNPDQIATKDIKIKYVEDLNDGNPIPNSQIYFAYLDINSSTWKTKMVKTDAKGFAKFEVPLRESGDSYAFIYAATNEQEFNEKLDNAKEGKIYLWKIPANDDIKYLELWLDKNMSQSNKVGSMQICM